MAAKLFIKTCPSYTYLCVEIDFRQEGVVQQSGFRLKDHFSAISGYAVSASNNLHHKL